MPRACNVFYYNKRKNPDASGRRTHYSKFFTRKNSHKPPSKKKKRGKNLSPRNKKACRSIISTALLQSIAEIRIQRTMKINRKTLHELSQHIYPPKNAAKEHNYFDERNVAYGHNYQSANNESQQHPCHGSDELPPK
jgi:hypothetical protein